jgi:hypothetical protein
VPNTFSLALLAVAGCAAEPTFEPLAETFSPQYPLWTDGATKHRSISLPSPIDASGEAWKFPVGTKLSKEFSFGGVVAETRFMEKTARGWEYSVRVGERAFVAPGVAHVVPRATDCQICHTDGPLGFSALQLSSDRDPNAAHREPAVGIDLAGLIDRGMLRGYRGPRAPGIEARTPTERAALGYLHGNCGGCHNARTSLASLEMELTPAAAVRATTIGRASRFAPARARIAPHAPEASVVVERMRARDPVTQMPPLGSQLVDREGVELVSAWIAELP